METTEHQQKAIEMIQELIKHPKIYINGRGYLFKSSGKYSATYESSKGTEYKIVASPGVTVRGNSNALVYVICRKGKSVSFALDNGLIFEVS
jgi:hypothetical protein